MSIGTGSIGAISHLSISIIKAWDTGNKTLRGLISAGAVLSILAILTAVIGSLIYPEKDFPFESKIILVITLILLFTSAVLILITASYIQNKEDEKKEEIIIEKEKEALARPNEPKLAWDVARIKLEGYLDRNISQVKSIFYLSLIAFFVGFGLIIYASFMAFENPVNFNPSIIASISGIIVNFIGASFLILYKSIVRQAKDYVTVLERINAVGMSVQIIDSIKEEDLKLKETTKAELAKKLIELYSNIKA